MQLETGKLYKLKKHVFMTIRNIKTMTDIVLMHNGIFQNGGLLSTKNAFIFIQYNKGKFNFQDIQNITSNLNFSNAQIILRNIIDEETFASSLHTSAEVGKVQYSNVIILFNKEFYNFGFLAGEENKFFEEV